MLGWLRVPLGVLMLLSLRSIWGVASRVNLEGLAICGAGAPSDWEKVWSPAQLAAVVLVTFLVMRQMKRSH